MKKKLTKIIFLVGFLLVSFFVSQNVFAEAGDKGIIIESFEYDQNGELTLSWSVDDGYENIFYNFYNKELEMLYIMDTPYENIAISDTGYGSGWVRFYTSLLDCLEPFDENIDFQQIEVSDFGSKTCSIKFYKIFKEYGGEIYPSTGDYITKTDIDNAFYTDFLETISISFSSGPWYFLGVSTGGNYTFQDENDPISILTYSNDFPILGTPISVNGVCGSANGSTFDWADFDNQDFCSSGDFYLSGDNGERIIYACEGLNGGTTQYNCSASYYYNGACGSASNSSFSSLDISNTDLCSSGYVSESSFLESGSGWTWVCSGSGSSSFCNATKSLISFPEMPEETDCSSLTFPDNLLCNIENLLKTGFLPSASALNNLNNAVNQVQQKAPFNYLNVAIEKISSIKSNITAESISISLMGNNSTLNINPFTSDFMPSVKSFFILMIVFGFIFWGIAYIKHFFK